MIKDLTTGHHCLISVFKIICMKHLLASLAICLCLCQNTYSQANDTLRNNRRWNAQWIALNNPFDRGTAYGVYYFRKSIELANKPSRFIIHISADNHYKLYVNGKLVSIGPARGAFYNWNYETVDNVSPVQASLPAGSSVPLEPISLSASR